MQIAISQSQVTQKIALLGWTGMACVWSGLLCSNPLLQNMWGVLIMGGGFDPHGPLITCMGDQVSPLFALYSKTRKMERRCGTPPYAAPEVVAGVPHHAQPADVWSCAVVLTAMLAGELPWDEPTESVTVLLHKAISKCLNITTQVCHEQQIKRIKRSFSNDNIAVSQPISAATSLNSTREIFDTISFSQPLHPEYMILSQLDATQGASQATQNKLSRLVRRLTRFLIKMELVKAEIKLSAILNKLKLPFIKFGSNTQFTVTTADRRSKALSFKVQLLEMTDSKLLLDFRLSKGDGLEFKKAFRSVRKEFNDYIVKNSGKRNNILHSRSLGNICGVFSCQISLKGTKDFKCVTTLFLRKNYIGAQQQIYNNLGGKFKNKSLSLEQFCR
eukprot:sb/3465556/